MGTVQRGTVRHGTVWCGTVQCGRENTLYSNVVTQVAFIGVMQIDTRRGAQVSHRRVHGLIQNFAN